MREPYVFFLVVVGKARYEAWMGLDGRGGCLFLYHGPWGPGLDWGRYLVSMAFSLSDILTI